MDGAVAALGDDTRQYVDVAPTLLIGREWTGVAVMRLPDRAGYHLVRTPHVTESDAARLIGACAGLREPPHTPRVVGADQAVEEVVP
jgi:S-DNA-T family DNA segregation ATPase FtsK/SpoIIIE